MSIYRDLLGPLFCELPAEVQTFHDPQGVTVWRGKAEVTRGRSVAAGLACAVFGFPRDGKDVPLTLKITAIGGNERWDRDFGGRLMSTVQTARDGILTERLGLIRIHMTTHIGNSRFSVQPVAWSFLGLPLPRALMPTTQNAETGENGTFRFDVAIAAPFAGPIVSYRGFLEKIDA